MIRSWFAGGLVASACCFGFPTDPEAVDQSTALRFGQTEFSHYIVDKNYNAFTAGFRSAHGRAPTADETATWFRLFIAQMGIKAQLAVEGWLDRSDVFTTVSDMSRYILTKADGPLYERFYRRGPIHPDRLTDAWTASKWMFDASIVRFDSEESARSSLGVSGDIAAFLTRRRSDAVTGLGADVHDGIIQWPYHPFEEIGSQLAAVVRGKFVGPIRGNLGVYYVMVRDACIQLPSTPADLMEQGLRDMDDDMVRRRRRADILRKEAFSEKRAEIEDFVLRLRSIQTVSQTFPEELCNADSGAVLASYISDGLIRSITAKDFMAHFNRRLFRSIPDNPVKLEAALEDMVVEGYDEREARRLGLHRTPKFVEDQRNFAFNQALSAYEREVLLPQIRPTLEELQGYAAAHDDAYLASVECTGSLYIFADQARARKAMVQLRRGDDVYAAEVRDPLILTLKGPQLTPFLPNSLVIAAPDGTLFEPFAYEKRWAVLLKRVSSGRVAQPFADIELQVRHHFLRAKLNDIELAQFAKGSAASSFYVALDPRKYGLPEGFNFRP